MEYNCNQSAHNSVTNPMALVVNAGNCNGSNIAEPENWASHPLEEGWTVKGKEHDEVGCLNGVSRRERVCILSTAHVH